MSSPMMSAGGDGRGGAETCHPDLAESEKATAAPDLADTIAGTTAGAGGADTEVVPPVTQPAPGFAWSAENGYGDTRDWPDTGVNHQLDAPDEDEPIWVTDASWRACLAIAMPPILFVVAVLALVSAVVAWFGLGHDGAPQSVSALAPSALPAAALPPISSEPMPSPAAVPAAAPPPPVTVTVTETPVAAPAPAPAPAPVATATPVPKASTPDPDTVFRNLVLRIPGLTVTNWAITEAGAHNVCSYLGQGHTRDDTVQQVLTNDPTFTGRQASAMIDASTAAYCPQYGG